MTRFIDKFPPLIRGIFAGRKCRGGEASEASDELVVGRLEVVGDNYGTRPCESSAERSGHCRVGEALQVYKNCCAVADRRVIRGKGDSAEAR